MSFKVKDKVRLTNKNHPDLEVRGVVCEKNPSGYMPGVYTVCLEGHHEAFSTSNWDVEVTEPHVRDYPDGLYVIQNDEDDDHLTEYIVLRMDEGVWSAISGKDDSRLFLHDVREGKHEMVRLVKEVGA